MNQLTDEQLFQEAIQNLKFTIQTYSQTQRQVAIRVRILIRSIMIGLGAALLFILYLLYILTVQVDALSDTLDKISEEAGEVQSNTNRIEIIMMTFEAHLEDVPRITHSVRDIDKNISSINTNVKGITQDISLLSSEMTQVTHSLQGVSMNVSHLDEMLVHLNHDIKAATKPVRRFNQLNPFDMLP